MTRQELINLIKENGIHEDCICNLGHLNFSQDQAQWICTNGDYTIIWLQDVEPELSAKPDFIWHYEKGFIDLDTLGEVLTAPEAANLWGLDSSTVKKACLVGRFTLEEARKSAGTWLVTRAGMERIYGAQPGQEGE